MELRFDQIPAWISLPIVVAAVAALAIFGAWQVRKRHTLDELVQNNEIAGFKFGVIGVLYAVVLGMAVVAVWEDFKDAVSNAETEANLVGDLYRDVKGLEPASSDAMRSALKAYCVSVIQVEWPKMEAGERDPKTQALFEELFTTCLQINPRDDRENIVLAEVFSGLNRLADARRSRISDAHMRMPGLLWFTLIAGGGITITFTFFFGNRNWRAHCLMTALLSGMIAMMLFVIHEVDHPYGGSVRVKPDSIERVLKRIQSL
ncbi:MAG: DUF4239 domain-containing protein [Fimbriimonadaceae bacterium]|nr:DUF4239 domain-containing protein [Fimbriimonadaceae bacterium]